MKSPRKSTAILLTRGDFEELELFVVLRNPSLSFFGGYWALPGGVVDAGDQLEEDWNEELLHQSCGLRELFEESGVLPERLKDGVQEEARSEMRAALLDDQDASAWLRILRAAPEALAELHPLGQLTTPPFSSRRYRTFFYQLELPAGEQPSIQPGELMEGEFLRPAEILQRWREGKILVVPPLIAFLDFYDPARGLANWRDDLKRRTAQSESGSIHRIRHVPGIQVLPLRTPTLPPATTTNTHIVGCEALYIVDPATPYEDERAHLFAFLDERMAEGYTLAGIIVTHHHHDHVASVAPLAQHYDLEVLGHPLTLERLPDPPARSRPLVDGDRIELGHTPDGEEGWYLEALHTPGHDRGHLAFIDNRYKSLIAGDLVSTLSTILIDPPEGNLAHYLQSLRRVLALKPGVVHPAHGIAHPRGTDFLRRYLAHRAMREGALVRALQSGLETLPELVARVYQDIPSDQHEVASRSLIAGLEKLEEEGRTRRHADGWQLLAEQ